MAEPENHRRSIFARGRWGYDVLFIFIVVLLISSPFSFLRTKKEHALEQIHRWQDAFRQQKKARVRFSGVARTEYGIWVFEGQVFIESGQTPDIHMRLHPAFSSYPDEEHTPLEATYLMGRSALRRFLAIYTHLTEEVFEINDVWIVRREPRRILLYFPEMSRGQLQIYHVYLWGRKDQWVPESLTFQTDDGNLYTFYFAKPEPYDPLRDHPLHVPEDETP